MTTIRNRPALPALKTVERSLTQPLETLATQAPVAPQSSYGNAVTKRLDLSGTGNLLEPRTLDDLLRTHLSKQASPSAGTLLELLSKGVLESLPKGTLDQLKAAANELRPAVHELGVLGGALVGAMLDGLSTASSIAELTAPIVFNELVNQALPGSIAEVLTQGQPPAVTTAAKEFLDSGFLSPDTFTSLGAGDLGRLAVSLEKGRSQLEGLLANAGQALLASGAKALGHAALKQVRTFDSLVKTFLSSVPPDQRPFWSERAQAKVGDGATRSPLPGRAALGQRPIDQPGSRGASGTVLASGEAGVSRSGTRSVRGSTSRDVGFAKGTASGEASATGDVFAGASGRISANENGVDASGRAGVGVRGHAEASGHAEAETGISRHTVSGHAEADGEAFAGVDATAHAGADGVSFNARAGASASASAKAEADMTNELFGGLVGADTHVEGSASARAAAQVTVEGHVGFDKEGDVEAFVGASAQAVALVEAKAKASQSINIFGFKFILGGSAAASAGVGGEAAAGAGYKDGRFFAFAGAGAAAEAGADVSGFAAVELPPWAQAVMNMVAKTDAGRAALGSVGNAVNPLVQGLSGLLASGSAKRG